MNELTDLSLSEAATRIAAGELCPIDLLDAQLALIDAVDRSVQAWAYVDAERARARAVELCAVSPTGSLHGVAIGMKDVFHVAGMPTRANSKSRAGVPPEAADGTITARLRDAGAIILGKTQTAEYAMADAPPTRNPWNLEHTPGGSSSGSGAAVGAHMVGACFGTQTGGSNLRPAAYCGVAALKPTYGRFSRHGLFAVSWTLDHPGVIARTVADLQLVYHAVAGYDPADPTSSSTEVKRFSLRPSPAPRIGILRPYFLDKADDATRESIEAALGACEIDGATVAEATLPESFALVAEAHRLIIQAEVAEVHGDGYRANPELYGPKLGSSVETGSLIPATAYLRALRLRQAITSELAAMFAQWDVLAMPTAPAPAPKGIESTGDASLLSPWSFAGFPAVSVPSGLSPEGLPIGLQLVGPPNGEEQLLRAAAWVEDIVGTLPAPALMADTTA